MNADRVFGLAYVMDDRDNRLLDDANVLAWIILIGLLLYFVVC